MESNKGKGIAKKKGEVKKKEMGNDSNEEINWTKMGIVGPVMDQKECTACWAIIVLASIEANYKIKNPKEEELMRLSIQELIDCVEPEKKNCYPYPIHKAFKWIKENGIHLETDYGEYVARKNTCKNKKHRSGTIEIKNYTTVEINDEDALLKAVKQQPIAVELNICPKFDIYKRGIYWGPEPDSELSEHGLLIVGYGTDKEGINYWLAKNSWGESWGENGYVKIVRKSSLPNRRYFITAAAYPVI